VCREKDKIDIQEEEAMNKGQQVLIIARFVLVVVSLAVVVIAAAQFSVALDLGFARPIKMVAMAVGASLWVILAAFSLRQIAYVNSSFTYVMIWCMTIIAAISLAGVFVQYFAVFALIANAGLAAMLLCIIFWMFPEEWKISRTFSRAAS
jgi:hypothetical protein